MTNNYARGLQHYKEQSVNTMTPGEMLLLLYDDLVKRLHKAKIFAEQKHFDAFDKEVTRCKEIIAYLKFSLDRRYPISRNLMQLYDFFNYELIRLQAGRNLAIIGDLVPLIQELRDTFQQADVLAKNQRG